MKNVNGRIANRHLFRLDRLIPTVIVLGAAAAIVLSLFGITRLSLSERIVISLLGLLAADALTERIAVLDRLERLLSTLKLGKNLRSRQEIISIQQHAAGASEICILAVSAISIAHSNVHFFAAKIREGCVVRIILLNPESTHLKTFDLLYGTPTAANSIAASLRVLEDLLHEKGKGSFSIHLSELFLPFSMVMVDPATDHGSMVVEFYAYRKRVGERCHVHLTASEDQNWFRFYKDQFDSAWSDSRAWTGTQQEDKADSLIARGGEP